MFFWELHVQGQIKPVMSDQEFSDYFFECRKSFNLVGDEDAQAAIDTSRKCTAFCPIWWHTDPPARIGVYFMGNTTLIQEVIKEIDVQPQWKSRPEAMEAVISAAEGLGNVSSPFLLALLGIFGTDKNKPATAFWYRKGLDMDVALAPFAAYPEKNE